MVYIQVLFEDDDKLKYTFAFIDNSIYNDYDDDDEDGDDDYDDDDEDGDNE